MNRLKELREQKGMKQSELGRLLNVNNSAISKYESGKLQLTDDTLIKLSDIFGVSIDYILSRNDNDDIPPRISMTGNRIKTLRTEYNLTQRQLADILGLTPKMISFYESGQRVPPIDIVEKLANIFSKSSDYLIGLSSDDSRIEEFLSPKDQQILDIFHRDPERISELLQSFSKLSSRNKTIILGKCYELENEDEKSNTEKLNKEKELQQAT
mgnify:CR=1 FL=1